MPRWRTGRILAAVALVASTALLGSGRAGASITTTPTFGIDDTSLDRGVATNFNSVFTMADGGTAQATLNNLTTALIGSFNPTCLAEGGRTCTVSATGLVTVGDGGTPAIEDVSVTISGTIKASANVPLDSPEGAAPTPLVLGGLTVSVSQAPGAAMPSPTRSITIGPNAATDAEVQITTTAPAPTGATAGRGGSIAYTATLHRVGQLGQTTTATASLVADTTAGTTLAPACPGAADPGPCGSKPVVWAAADAADKTVTLTVNVPANTGTGATATYHIEVSYDSNTAAPDTASVDKEIGNTRSFLIVPGTNDAIVTLATTAPTGTPMVPRGGTVDYTATLTRSGNTAQSTDVSLSLVADSPTNGTVPGALIHVPFAPGDLTSTRTITVNVPIGATLGTVSYHFHAAYDPTGTDGPPSDVFDGAPQSFQVTAAEPTLTLTNTLPPPGTTVDRGQTFDLKATLSNPSGALDLTTGKITVTVPVGLSVGVPTATTGSLPGEPTTVPAGAGATPQVVTVTYGTIARGDTKVLTVPVTVLASAMKVPGPANDLVVNAAFVSAAPGPVKALATSSAFEITPSADIQMHVNAPSTEQLDPTSIAIPVTYSVTNAGPDPAAGVSFVANKPAGAVAVTLNSGGDGPDTDNSPDWNCTTLAITDPSTMCTYTGVALNPGTPTALVTITWTFDTTGTKTFTARATTSTNDPSVDTDPLTPDNNDASATTDISNPTSGVTITASSPSPVPVAADKDAAVSVVYTVKNFGPKNIKANLTATAPAGAVLQSLTGSAGVTCTVATASCDLGTLKKDGTLVTVTAVYQVPQSAFTLNQVTFSASIEAVNGSFATPTCPPPPGPPVPPACSITTASVTVSGTPPTIDIGLAPVPGDPVVNRPDGTTVSAVGPVIEPRTFTFQNFSTDLTVRAGTAFVELTIPATPTPSIGIPGGCVLTANPSIVRCPISGVVPVATGSTPGTASLTLSIPLQTADAVTFTARAVVDDPGNRATDSAAATPDSRQVTLDLNRTPSVVDDVGPAIPGGGTLSYFPIPLHKDDDTDALTVVSDANLCATAGNCVEAGGGTITGLSVTATSTKVAVTFTSVTPAGTTPVTVLITYGVTDTKSSTSSKVLVRLVPSVGFTVNGSYGNRPATPPQSFGQDVPPALLGDSVNTFDLLAGDLGKKADGTAFAATPTPGATSYALTSVDQNSINVTGSSATVPAGAVTDPKMVTYVPAKGYTSDTPNRAGTDLGDAPPDSFTYLSTGTRNSVQIFTVESAVSVGVRNQQPIGLDTLIKINPGSGPAQVQPASNDIDGNTLPTDIVVKSGGSFTFDDEGKRNPAAPSTIDHGLQIACLGPVPTLDPVTKLPAAMANCTDPGKKDVGAPLEVPAPDGSGKITATLDADRKTVKVTVDATVAGFVPFVAVVSDSYGGAGWSLVTIEIPDQPPEIIPGKQTVPMNSPPVVVLDTRLTARDANGDTVKVSSITQPAHGKAEITDGGFTITYTPTTGYFGPDSLVLNVSDGRGGVASNQAQLNIDVVQPATQPVAISSSPTAAGGGSAASATPASGALAKTGGDPVALTLAAGLSLLLGFALVHAGRRRQTLPLLAQARHLRT